MDRSSFLKSLFMVVAAPKMLAELDLEKNKVVRIYGPLIKMDKPFKAIIIHNNHLNPPEWTRWYRYVQANPLKEEVYGLDEAGNFTKIS